MTNSSNKLRVRVGIGFTEPETIHRGTTTRHVFPAASGPGAFRGRLRIVPPPPSRASGGSASAREDGVAGVRHGSWTFSQESATVESRASPPFSTPVEIMIFSQDG